MQTKLQRKTNNDFFRVRRHPRKFRFGSAGGRDSQEGGQVKFGGASSRGPSPSGSTTVTGNTTLYNQQNVLVVMRRTDSEEVEILPSKVARRLSRRASELRSFLEEDNKE